MTHINWKLPLKQSEKPVPSVPKDIHKVTYFFKKMIHICRKYIILITTDKDYNTLTLKTPPGIF
jgi:hypothetical protein